VGRFCLNCGHLIGAPVPPPPTLEANPAAIPETPPAPPPDADPAPDPAPARAASTWDPARDLLPFDDDSRHWRGSTGLSGRAMLAWVVGAALLVGLVLLLLRVYGDATDTDDTATDPSGQESASVDPDAAEGPASIGKMFNAARGATFEVSATAPATRDLDGQLVGYAAAQMGDGIPATAWRMAGDGTGSVITIVLRRPTVVSRVGLINGYAKQISGVDWYPNNRRLLTAQWAFDDGTTVEQTFAERPTLQRMEVPAVLTETVTLTISSVTPPGLGTLGRDYTAISEVAIMGRRAR